MQRMIHRPRLEWLPYIRSLETNKKYPENLYKEAARRLSGFFIGMKIMGKTFKSPISAAYGSNMSRIIDYGNSLPSRATKTVRKRLPKSSLVDKVKDNHPTELVTVNLLHKKYGLRLEVAIDFLKEFRSHNRKVRNNEKEIKEEIEKLDKKADNVLSVSDRLSSIRERYASEIRIHGEETTVKEGFVYLMRNVSFPGWVKAGMTIDYEQRLGIYNQCDPEKRFEYIGIKWIPNRRIGESILLEELGKAASFNHGEWFRIDEALCKEIFLK